MRTLPDSPRRRGLLATTLVATGLIALGGLAACAVSPPYPPIPPLRAEVQPPQTRLGEVFVPGHWHWDGREYQWNPGHWTVQPVGMARFVPGRWAARGGNWEWIPAHWDR